MNEQHLVKDVEINHFFFENHLYEFSQKKLPAFQRDKMKAFLSEDIQAKKKIASVLMSLEYLEDLSEIGLSIDNIDKILSKKKMIKKYLNLIFLILSAVVFLIVGAFILNLYQF